MSGFDKDGKVTVVVPYGVSVAANHVLDDYASPRIQHAQDTWRTLCGRDASEWARIDDQAVHEFHSGAYSCKRCVAKIYD